MHARSMLAVLSLLTAVSGCANPDAAAKIENRRTNALATINAVRDSYCALPPAIRAKLRASRNIDPTLDSCTPPPETAIQEVIP